MATYTGTFNVSQDLVSTVGDGDEGSFPVSAAGTVTLTLTPGPGNTATIVGTGSGSASGFAIGETDGDTDNFSFSGQGTSSSSVQPTNGIFVDIPLGTAGDLEFSGSLNSTLTQISGTLSIDDFNDGVFFSVPLSLTGSGGTGTTPTISNAIDLLSSITSVNVDGVVKDFTQDVAGGALQIAGLANAGLKYLLSSNPKVVLSGIPGGVRDAIVGDLQYVENALSLGSTNWSSITWKQAADTSGRILSAASLANTLFQAGSDIAKSYQQTGALLTTQTQQALIKMDGAVLTGLAGEIISSAAGTAVIEGLVGAGAIATGVGVLAPIAVGIAIGAATSYLIKSVGSTQTVIDETAVIGPQSILNQSNQDFKINISGQQDLAAAGGFTQSPTVAVTYGNSIAALGPGNAVPQPSWTYNADTGQFTWLASSTAALDRALSQMGITQFAVPLTLTGDDNGDIIQGGPLANSLTGGAGNDVLIGGSGSNTFKGGGGNDVIQGGSGSNTAVYSGPMSSYTIVQSGATFTVTDNRSGSPDGTDTLTNVQTLQFSDQSFSLFGRAPTPTNFLIASGSVVPSFSSSASVSLDLSKVTVPQTITGLTGDDLITIGGAGASVTTLAGNDQIVISSGSTAADAFTGVAGHHSVTASGGNNALSAGSGTDLFTVTGGSNTIATGTGWTEINATGGSGVILALQGTGQTTVSSSAYILGIGGGNQSVSVTGGAPAVIETGGASTLTASAGAPLVGAFGGTHQITTGSGGGTIFSLGAAVTITGGSGTTGVDLVAGQAQLVPGTGELDLFVNGGANTLVAKSGGNVVISGFTANHLAIDVPSTINGSAFTSASQIPILQSGGNTVLDLGSNGTSEQFIVLAGVSNFSASLITLV